MPQDELAIWNCRSYGVPQVPAPWCPIAGKSAQPVARTANGPTGERPVPTFTTGDPEARLVIIGLAPAATEPIAQGECSPGTARGIFCASNFSVRVLQISRTRRARR